MIDRVPPSALSHPRAAVRLVGSARSVILLYGGPLPIAAAHRPGRLLAPYTEPAAQGPGSCRPCGAPAAPGGRGRCPGPSQHTTPSPGATGIRQKGPPAYDYGYGFTDGAELPGDWHQDAAAKLRRLEFYADRRVASAAYRAAWSWGQYGKYDDLDDPLAARR